MLTSGVYTDMTFLSARFFAAVVAVFLGWLLFGWTTDTWRSYWLRKDGQQGIAVVTKELWTGHDSVAYRYTVNEKEYAGQSMRNWREQKYSRVGLGERSVVYFSASHPWLSLLFKPDTAVEGLPVLLLVVVLEALALLTIINPKSRWALNFSGTK
ncbi:MAG: hypothetical protein DMG31_09365 [Acidobacteria bacterium]|nr:MAG: hypothetical protein DMG31_09365 [Acidobacteriota bacterium]